MPRCVSPHSFRPVTASVGIAVLLVVLCLGLSACSGTSADAPQPAPTQSVAPASALLETGLTQLRAGDAEAASGTFENVLTLDPRNVYALYNLGLIAQQGGHRDLATRYYRRALAAQDDFVPALFNSAILEESSDLRAAVATYREVVRISPDTAAAHVRLGFALIHLGDLSEGKQEIAAGVRLDPSLANATSPTYR